jgi:hypothetical protein
VFRGEKLVAGVSPDPLALQFMHDSILRLSLLNDEPAPHDGYIFSTTFGAGAHAISGGTAVVDAELPVYLVLAHGNFTERTVPGSDNYVGHSDAMVVMFDAQTLELRSLGFVGPDFNPSSLGPAVPLPL